MFHQGFRKALILLAVLPLFLWITVGGSGCGGGGALTEPAGSGAGAILEEGLTNAVHEATKAVIPQSQGGPAGFTIEADACLPAFVLTSLCKGGGSVTIDGGACTVTEISKDGEKFYQYSGQADFLTCGPLSLNGPLLFQLTVGPIPSSCLILECTGPIPMTMELMSSEGGIFMIGDHSVTNIMATFVGEFQFGKLTGDFTKLEGMIDGQDCMLVEMEVVCESDSDGDGFPDHSDNCPSVKNPSQNDGDGDGVGNVCDNCITDPNSDQMDTDGDKFGDACDDAVGEFPFVCPGPAPPPSGDQGLCPAVNAEAIPCGDTACTTNQDCQDAGLDCCDGQNCCEINQPFCRREGCSVDGDCDTGSGEFCGPGLCCRPSDCRFQACSFETNEGCDTANGEVCFLFFDDSICCKPSEESPPPAPVSLKAQTEVGSVCGDGFLQPGESCEPCAVAGTLGSCEDGFVCSGACQCVVCGDGICDTEAGEEEGGGCFADCGCSPGTATFCVGLSTRCVAPCDGDSECVGEVDETNAFCEGECPPGTLNCREQGSGLCAIPCDANTECPFGTDETGCGFECGNGIIERTEDCEYDSSGQIIGAFAGELNAFCGQCVESGFCGDGACDLFFGECSGGKGGGGCDLDCTPELCSPCDNDGVCDGAIGEDGTNCFDCSCGRIGCQPDLGEDQTTCPDDCPCNNDDVCDSDNREDEYNCFACSCGNFYCQPDLGENYNTCFGDCLCNYDGVCQGASVGGLENTSNCFEDCHCGDGYCQSYVGENFDTCPPVPPAPPDCCSPNGVCEPEGGENVENCIDCSCEDGECQAYTTGEHNCNCPGDCPISPYEPPCPPGPAL